jgi:SSS family solute:Na+ symporter
MWGRSVLGLVPRLAARQKLGSQIVVAVAGALALVLTYTVPNTLVRLSLISYEGMAQLVPMILLGLVWRRLTLWGALSGLAVGGVLVCALVFTEHDPVGGVNAGIVALAANLAVALAVSWLGPRPADERPDEEVLARDVDEPAPAAV